jgi:apolipoprotein N-acyltransferase
MMQNSEPTRLVSFAAASATALLLALAMPGRIGCWPLLFAALVPLLSVVPGLRPMRAACMGMFCGLLYNIALLYWIVIVLGKYGGLPVWVSVPGMALLALYMGSYIALFCLLLSLCLGRSGSVERPVLCLLTAAPVLWVGLDFLRSFLFSGFPWMDLGYGLYLQPLLIQAADLGGHHLVTFFIVLVNGLLVVLYDRIFSKRPMFPGTERLPVIAACIFLFCIGIYSTMRHQQAVSTGEADNTAVISVIQGNIRQDEKWTPARKEQTVAKYITLSRRAVESRGAELVVWPETALPLYPQQDPQVAPVLDFVRNKQVFLLTGAPYFILKTDKNAGPKPIDYFNSGLLIDSRAQLVGRYDKQHLVPYGEYVPLRKYLPFLEPLVVSVGDFTAGASFQPLKAGKIRAGVLICFESIFPEIARKEVLAGSNLLVNITNDAWYGRSSAPYQSLAMSVFRAVETKRSLVRAANTGISGFISPGGDILSRSSLFEPAALTETVGLFAAQTVFTRYGHWFAPLCLILILPLLFVCRQRQRKV